METKQKSYVVSSSRSTTVADTTFPEFTFSVGTPATSKWSRICAASRRTFDATFALVAIVLTAPISLALILIIRLSSTGPAIYKHRRIGQNGVEFDCLKFRTMVPDADQALTALLQENDSYKREFEESQKLKDDPRVTFVGKFLRKVSLDELPQFWNILKGEMSVVGPRPIVEDEIVRYGPDLPIVLSVKPGLTGLWQVSGRNDIDYRERVALDRQYVLSRSFWSDVRIIVKTITVMVKRDSGAY